MGRQPRHRPAVAAARRGLRKQLAGHGVAVPRPREVNAYLGQHRGLAALVPLICSAARREFGGAAELSLELYRDPEIDDSYLTLYVRQAGYGRDLPARIGRVTGAYEHDLARCSGHLLVTSDFRAPRNGHGV